MEWDSPWGKGFPGWHIECSAMSMKYLDAPMDIHCGGMDHVRVHHTNEIAQSEAATGQPFVKYWLHGEFLVLDKGKMAKSSGDFLTLDSLAKEAVRPLAYRMFCYTAHYRSPLLFSWDGLKAAANGLANLKKQVAAETMRPGAGAAVPREAVEKILSTFFESICDDMNLPAACGHLWTLLKDTGLGREEKYAAVEIADAVLALDLLTDEHQADIVTDLEKDGVQVRVVSASAVDRKLMETIASLVAERQTAKKARSFDKADGLRAALLGMGVEIKDLPGGRAECRVGAR
jgi:cysteinyl-tRNA synthetase